MKYLFSICLFAALAMPGVSFASEPLSISPQASAVNLEVGKRYHLREVSGGSRRALFFALFLAGYRLEFLEPGSYTYRDGGVQPYSSTGKIDRFESYSIVEEGRPHLFIVVQDSWGALELYSESLEFRVTPTAVLRLGKNIELPLDWALARNFQYEPRITPEGLRSRKPNIVVPPEEDGGDGCERSFLFDLHGIPEKEVTRIEN